METFGFEKALTFLKEGKALSRKAWDSPDCFIAINHRGKEIPVRDLWTQPIKDYLIAAGQETAKIEGSIMMVGWGNKVVNWVNTPSDLLEEDWFEVHSK